MWSRLAKVAQDLAQDLAQPEVNDEEDEEEVYDNANNWGGEEEVYDPQAVLQEEEEEEWPQEDGGGYYHDDEQQQPQHQPQQPYYGDQTTEEYYDDQQQLSPEEYQTEEHYYNDQEPGAEIAADDGWGQDDDKEEEEEVDFTAEQDDAHAHYEPQTEVFQEVTGGTGGNDWDLEDEDLFGEEEQTSPSHEELVAVTSTNEPEPETDNVAANNGNELGGDGGFDFDDSHVQQQQQQHIPLPPVVNTQADMELIPEDNDWGADDLDLDDSNLDLPNITTPAGEEPILVESNDRNIAGNATVEAGTEPIPRDTDWGDDDLNLDHSNLELTTTAAAAAAALTETNLEPTTGTAAIADEVLGAAETNDWGDDDLNLDDVDPHIATPVESNPEPTAGANDWGDDDLNLDDVDPHIATPVESNPEPTAGANDWGDDDLNLDDVDPHSATPVESNPEPTTGASDWGDDNLDFDNSHEQGQAPPEVGIVATEPVPSEDLAAIQQETFVDDAMNDTTDNAWGNEESLNFDESPLQVEALVTADIAEPAVGEVDPENSEAVAEQLADNEWGNDESLNFHDSDIQEETTAAVHHEAEVSPEQVQQSLISDGEAPPDAWDEGDDLAGLDNFPVQTEAGTMAVCSTSAEEDEEPQKKDPSIETDVPIDAWGNDDDDLDDLDTSLNQPDATSTNVDATVEEEPQQTEQHLTQPLSHDTFDTAEEDHGVSWFDDSLAQDDSQQNEQRPFKNAPESDLAVQESHDTFDTAAQESESPHEIKEDEEGQALNGDSSAGHIGDIEEMRIPIAGSEVPQSGLMADSWGDDDLRAHDDEKKAPAKPRGSISLDSVVEEDTLEEELQVFEDGHQDNTWRQHHLHFNHGGDGDTGARLADAEIEEEQGEDDSTVEQSNIGFEQSVEDFLHGDRQSMSARRVTVRLANTRNPRRDSGGSETAGEKILGTSVTFTEHNPDQQAANLFGGIGHIDERYPTADTAEQERDGDVQDQDAVSTVSDLTDIPRSRFETQISMMTLKSAADSVPSSRHDGNESDDVDDDERGYGPVVDKTPELSADQNPVPCLSAMTINSTAVAAHSVSDDIQRDDEMDDTLDGGSATVDVHSADNGWGDDASSLGGISERGPTVEVAPVLPTPPTSILSTPLTDTIPEETPGPDSSMANLYTDDNSVPSRDKDDDNEDEYKPVVDQIPQTLKKLLTEKSGRTLGSLVVLSGEQRNEESESQKKPPGGDGWDDGESLGGLDSQGGDLDKEGQAGPTVAEDHIVVDKTPNEDGSIGGHKAEGSLAAVASIGNSCPSRVNEDNEEVYGLVVDQIPEPIPTAQDQQSVAASSMAVIATNVEQELKHEDELDASDHGDSDGSNGSCVVDLKQEMESRALSALSSNSLAVLTQITGQDFEAEVNEEEGIVNFGHSLDRTSALNAHQVTTPGSTAAHAIVEATETKQEESIGAGIACEDDENPELQAIKLDNETAKQDAESKAEPEIGGVGAKKDQEVIVDHTPEAEDGDPLKTKGDASLAVLAPSEDGTCLSFDGNDDDADTIDPQGERVSYGPVVDTLPSVSARPPGTAHSVTFSLAVEARSVDEDFKLDDEMDETFCGDVTQEGGGSTWGDDQTLGSTHAPSITQVKFRPKIADEAIVDHTPSLASPHPRGDLSIVALAPSESATYPPGDSVNDDDTITHETDLYGQVVDYTPKMAAVPFVKSTSMAVGACSTECRLEMEKDDCMDESFVGELDEGWGGDEEALDQIAGSQQTVFNADLTPSENLVDHTPEAGDETKTYDVDPSVAVLVPSEDSSNDCEEDDNDSHDGNNAYGPVVDSIPQPPDIRTIASISVATRRGDGDPEETLFGDSTIGGETGWEDDDAILDDIVENENDTLFSEAGNQINNQTPFHVNVESGISGDETDIAGAVSWEENDGIGPQNSTAEDEDQVVDRIPQGPGSRFGDASTVVVADPSEVISHVGDDLLQEDGGDFGPVVDLTPPTRPASVLTSTRSTVAVASAVPHDDDLDDADHDDTVDADEENVWAHDEDVLELAPNPQSGNDVDAAAREQVVDFLPPPEEAAAVQNREGWSQASEVATGGAPSVLQTDPKEEDYGPVVDQLPLPTLSNLSGAMSTASHVASSECALMAKDDELEEGSKQTRSSNANDSHIVDPLPRPFEMAMQNPDSTASLAQSLASEDEDDVDKYGPVVDHLPSRGSLPPSHGGSTVDALATVSEVIDDDEDDDDGGDGSTVGGAGGGEDWVHDDLAEIDAPSESKDGASDQNSAGQSDRGMTVRFRSVVAAIFDADAPTDNAAAIQGSSLVVNENQDIFHNSTNDTGGANAWDDDLDLDASSNMDFTRATGGSDNDHSNLSSPQRYAYTQFTEADTPPATPYNKVKDPNGLPSYGVALPELSLSLPSASPQCNTCADASSIDCPCVQRILKQKDGGDDIVQVDYNKLLQNEISKRLLIETEANDLRSHLETLRALRPAGEVNMETIQTLQEHVKIVEDKLREKVDESRLLHTQNEELAQALGGTEASLTEWNERHEEWSKKEALLRQDIILTRDTFESAISKAEQQHKARESEFLAESKENAEELEKLSTRTEELQQQCQALQDRNAALVAELDIWKTSLEGRDETIQSLYDNEERLQQEIEHLIARIQEAESANAANTDAEQQRTFSETELAASKAECEKLTSDIELLLERVQKAEAGQYTQMTEQAKLAKQYQEAIAQRERSLAAAQAQLKQMQRDSLDKASAYSANMLEIESNVGRLTEEKNVLEKAFHDLQSSVDKQVADLRSELNQKESELEAGKKCLNSMQAENKRLTGEMERLDSIAHRTLEVEEKLRNAEGDRDILTKSLGEANEQVAKLEEQIEVQRTNEGDLKASKDREIEALRADRDNLEEIISKDNEEIEALQIALGQLGEEKEALEKEAVNLRAEGIDLKASAESYQSTVAESDIKNQLELSSELESLREQLNDLANEREALHQERQMLASKVEELERALQTARQGAESNAFRINELDAALAETQKTFLSLQQSNDALARERDEILVKNQELEQMLTDSLHASQEAASLRQENQSLSEQFKSIEQEKNNQAILVQDFEARMDALQSELLDERTLSAEKDGTIVELQREVESTRANLEQTAEGASLLPSKIAELETVTSRLQAERDELQQNLCTLASKEQEFQGVCESLSQDRDTALGERDALATENEEMLVQFGLLNQQIEAHNEQIRLLKDQLEQYQQSSEASEAHLQELQERLSKAESSARDAREAVALEQDSDFEELRAENSQLSEQIDALTVTNAEKDAAIAQIEAELEVTQKKLQDKEEALDQSASVATKVEGLRAQVLDLELQRSDFEARLYDRSSEMAQLQCDLDVARDESLALENQVKVLEAACANRDQALQQKDKEMRDVVKRLHETSGHSSETTQEILGLRDRLSEMEAAAREHSTQSNELMGKLERAQAELYESRDNVATLKASMEELQREMAEKEDISRLQSNEYGTKVSELQSSLETKSQELDLLKMEYTTLSTELNAALLDLGEKESRAADQTNLVSSEEIEKLRAELALAQGELEATREQFIEREEALLKSFATKEGEVVLLKNKVSSLHEKAQGLETTIQAKQRELESTRQELEDLRESKSEKGHFSAARLLQQTKENAEDVDNLRATVIALATALETSENRRADSIDRLLRERETYANSLRHLSDSVKRFYSAMSG